MKIRIQRRSFVMLSTVSVLIGRTSSAFSFSRPPAGRFLSTACTRWVDYYRGYSRTVATGFTATLTTTTTRTLSTRPTSSPNSIPRGIGVQATATNDDHINGHNEITIAPETTVQEALQQSLTHLQQQHANIDEPVASVTNILSVVLNLPWESGYRDLQQILQQASSPTKRKGERVHLGNDLAKQRLSATQAAELTDKLRRRLQHEPIQYLTGKWDFLDYTLQIRPPLLCPRPETEQLVQLVTDDLLLLLPETNNNHPDPQARQAMILDVGCGTGCIGIALADQFPQASVTAIDVEPVAVETSLTNAQAVLGDDATTTTATNSARYQAQLCSAQDFSPDNDNTKFDVIVSNPPYIPLHDMEGLDRNVRQYESATALTDGTSPDGMDVIRTIVQQLPRWCKPGAVCWMEVDPTQPALLQAFLQTDHSSDARKVDYVSTHTDLYGRDRFVKLRVR